MHDSLKPGDLLYMRSQFLEFKKDEHPELAPLMAWCRTKQHVPVKESAEFVVVAVSPKYGDDFFMRLLHPEHGILLCCIHKGTAEIKLIIPVPPKEETAHDRDNS